MCKRKTNKASFSSSNTVPSIKKLQLIHGDLCGQITPSTQAGKSYIFVLIDYTRYMWTILLENKSEAFTKFKKLRILVEHETRKKIQTIRTDRVGEFTSNEFNVY